MPIRRLTTTLLLALAALIAIAATATPARADGGVGFQVYGTPTAPVVDGYVHPVLSPGNTASGYLLVGNGTTSRVDLTVYPADGLTGTTSGIVFADLGSKRDGAGAWMSTSINSFSLNPGGEQRIDFTITVPPGATPGDHVGGIVMQWLSRSSTTQVRQVVRNVAPVHIEVPGPAELSLDVRDAELSNLPGTQFPAVDVTLRNSGRKICRPQLAVTLKGPSEDNVRVARQLDAILPGDRITYPLPWPSPLAPGSYVVQVNATGCGTARNQTYTSTTPGFDPNAGKDDPGESTASPTKPRVVTQARPVGSRYTPGSKLTGDDARGDDDATTSAASGDTTGGGTAPPTQKTPPGIGTMGTGENAPGSSLLSQAKHALVENGAEIAKRASLLVLLFAAIGFLFFIQDALDRRDPKLALAPVQRERELGFDSDPVATGAVKRLPSTRARAT